MSRLAAAIVVGVMLCAGPALADGKLNVVGKFANADTELYVATYVEVNGKGVEERVALLGIINGQRRNSITFSPNELPALLRLWRKASDVRSNQWQYVGDFLETGTSDVSHLKVSAGPGVRFIIESPALGAFTSDLQRANMAAFAAALENARVFIGAPAR
jgi:hypothetical protein